MGCMITLLKAAQRGCTEDSMLPRGLLRLFLTFIPEAGYTICVFLCYTSVNININAMQPKGLQITQFKNNDFLGGGARL